MWKEKPAPMRIFTAPLNSEVEVARNVHDLVRVLGPGKGKDVKVGCIQDRRSTSGGPALPPRRPPTAQSIPLFWVL